MKWLGQEPRDRDSFNHPSPRRMWLATVRLPSLRQRVVEASRSSTRSAVGVGPYANS